MGGEPMAQINWKYYRSDTDEFPILPWTFGWIQMRYEGEPLAQINWKYHGHDTDEFLIVPWTFGWIQMRYGGEPMAQINENITVAILMSFV